MNIVIIGAGTAGAATAIALAQRGHAVRVFERRKQANDIGAGVVLWPNASFVLAKLGLLPEVAKVSAVPPCMKRFSQAGELLSALDISALDRAMGFASHAILRRDLQAILLEKMAQLAIPVQYGFAALDMVRDARSGNAQVRFENGQTHSAELIVGAEGRMNSIARRYVHGDNTPVYQGFVNWVGTAAGGTDLVADMSIQDYWGRGQRFGIVPVGRGKVYWAGALAVPVREAVGRVDLKVELSALFGGWADPVAKLIAHSHADAIRKINIHDLEPIERWHKDNVLVIGDAAHAPLPTSGQGACQALEDAWHLAQCLTAQPLDLPAALSAFTQLRLEKTRAITDAARQFARALFSLDAETCRQRNQQARRADAQKTIAAMAAGWGAGLPL